MTREAIEDRVRELGPWFHNLDLRGVPTAPHHFLGDYPRQKFRHFASVVPEDLTGKTVLDIGCNAGFYAMELKRRGASRVVGTDSDPRYLAQARFAAEVNGLDIEFRERSVYDVALLGERFDLVVFMGVLYHLRHPLLALDLIREHVAGDLMLFQTLQRGATAIDPVAEDYDFFDTAHLDSPGYPKMVFFEHRYSHDPTNWWAPNAACTEAMLRSSGFEIVAHPEQEVYLCRRADLPDLPDGPRAVHAAPPPPPLSLAREGVRGREGQEPPQGRVEVRGTNAPDPEGVTEGSAGLQTPGGIPTPERSQKVAGGRRPPESGPPASPIPKGSQTSGDTR